MRTTISITTEAMDALETLPPYVRKGPFVADVVGNCSPKLWIRVTSAHRRRPPYHVREQSDRIIEAVKRLETSIR